MRFSGIVPQGTVRMMIRRVDRFVGTLWQDLVDVLSRRPLLWVPVLVADLLGYLANFGSGALLRAVVYHRTSQHSALSGAVIHAPLSASALESTTILALLLLWLTYFIRLLLFATAFITTAALLQAFHERAEKPAAAIAPALQRHGGGILELALRALSVYAVFALLFSWVRPYLATHGKAALLHNPWFDFGVTTLPTLVLAALLPPVALRVLASRGPDKETSGHARVFSLTLIVVILLLALIVSSNSRELAQVTAGARFPLEIIASLLEALPYVLLFTGFALLARRVARALD